MSGRTYHKLYENAERIFRNKLKEIDEIKEWDKKYPQGKEAYETKICYDFARLLILYPEIFSRHIYPLISRNKLTDASKLTMIFDEILVDIYTCALEGYYKVSLNKIKLLEKFGISNSFKSKENEIKVFPTDVARFLIKKLKIEYSSNLTIDELVDLTKDSAYRKAINALESLDSEISKKERKLGDRAKALREAWIELESAMRCYDTIKGFKNKVKVLLSLGVFGILFRLNPVIDPNSNFKL